MFKAILYKEWIKIRLFLIIVVSVSISSLLYIGFDVRHAIEMSGPTKNLLSLITYHTRYFSMIKYIPLVSGIALAIIQFVPEMTKNRFRLSFHLPIDERKLLMSMVTIGIINILLVSIILIVGLLIIGTTFYPVEITQASLMTSLPWLLAGFLSYFAASMIIVEPIWKFRVIYMVITYASWELFFQEYAFNQYVYSIWKYILFMTLFSIIILFPGYRLRKGSK